MARLIRLLVFATLVASGCSSTVVEERAIDGQPSAPDQAAVSQPTLDRGPDLQAELDDWAMGADGGAVAFVRDANGQVTLLAAGEDPQTGEPLDSSDRVRVGSISKVHTSVLVLQLVDEGLVELDAPISTYVDGLAIANDVTVRQLLGHRTGIPNYTESQGFFQVVIVNPDREPTPEDLIAFTNGATDFEPGTQYAYSNTNFIIAGMLVEAVTEMSLAEALETQIATPLQLSDTEFDDGSLTDVAGGYSGLTPSGNSYDQPYTSIAFGSWAAGGMVTTVDELSVFLDATVRGDLLSAESRAAMMEGLDSGAQYGLGLTTGSRFGVGHNGSIIGFNSRAELDPVTGEMVIVVVNNDMRNQDVAVGRLVDVLRGG